MKAGGVLRSRHGRVYVNFSEPVRLSELLEKYGMANLRTVDDDAFRAVTKRVSYHLMRKIHEAGVVAPSGLVSAVLLSHHRRGMSGTRLREMVGFIVDLMDRRDARLSVSLRHVLNAHESQIADADSRNVREGARARGEALPTSDEGLNLLKRLVTRSEQGQDIIYGVPDRSRIELDYYRNSVLSVLAPDCIIATAIAGAREPISYESLSAEARRLSYWFRLEFIYETSTTFEENFAETMRRLEEEKPPHRRREPYGSYPISPRFRISEGHASSSG